MKIGRNLQGFVYLFGVETVIQTSLTKMVIFSLIYMTGIVEIPQ